MSRYLIATPTERLRRYIRVQLWRDLGGSVVMLIFVVVCIVTALSGGHAS